MPRISIKSMLDAHVAANQRTTSHNGETQQAPDAAVAVKRAEFLVDMPPDLDPDHFPIIARHFFGWPPGRPTRENLLRLVRSQAAIITAKTTSPATRIHLNCTLIAT